MTKAIVETVKKTLTSCFYCGVQINPKPNPIIEYCNNFLTKVSVSRTFPNIFTKRIPNNKAIGGETRVKKIKQRVLKRGVEEVIFLKHVLSELSNAKLFKTKIYYVTFVT